MIVRKLQQLFRSPAYERRVYLRRMAAARMQAAIRARKAKRKVEQVRRPVRGSTRRVERPLGASLPLGCSRCPVPFGVADAPSRSVLPMPRPGAASRPVARVRWVPTAKLARTFGPLYMYGRLVWRRCG